MTITTEISTPKDKIKELIIKSLVKKTGGKADDDTVVVPNGFSVKVQIGRLEEDQGIILGQPVFIVDHPKFDESLIEPVDAQGRNEEACADMAVDVFMGGVWAPLMQSVNDEAPITIIASGPGIDDTFRMYCNSVVRVGESGEVTTLPMTFIQDELPEYLGRKKYYWVRIYLAKYRDKSTISVRINGTVCSDLEKFFTDYVENEMDASERFVSEKQYAIIVNDNEDVCPFTKDTVMKAAETCIKDMCGIRTPEDYEALRPHVMDVIRAGLPDTLEESEADRIADILASEIRLFVPEIFAKLTLGYSEGDSLFLLGDQLPDGTIESTEFKKTQLRSYFYIQQAVIMFLGTNPPKEDVGRIIANSAAFKELNKAISGAKAKGVDIKPSDFRIPGTSYMFGTDSYKVW